MSSIIPQYVSAEIERTENEGVVSRSQKSLSTARLTFPGHVSEKEVGMPERQYIPRLIAVDDFERCHLRGGWPTSSSQRVGMPIYRLAASLTGSLDCEDEVKPADRPSGAIEWITKATHPSRQNLVTAVPTVIVYGTILRDDCKA